MALISLRVPDEVAAELSVLAATQGGKSALLRRLIADALAAPAPRILALPVGRPEKVTVRFRESEMRQLAEVSHQRGMTRTGWIVALVRSRLGSPVQHSPDEHAALRAFVRELNRIGGNINQIARAANTSVLQGRAVELDLSTIQEAKLVIEKELAQLRNALIGKPIIGMGGDESALLPSAGRLGPRTFADLVCLGNAQSAPSAGRVGYPRSGRPGRLTPAMRAKLERILRRAPEVMVKITGRTKSVAHLKSHLAYITRNGELDAETEQGATLAGRSGLKDLQQRWEDDCRS
ncbi:MobC family plasmid mobilization relaxosome protein [Bradyrhizobium sp. 141]|uniref:MobC family plasmid mobilization relaxosome protein n=1 Tax=Bradyrhizobium sp. 141 TaxID=2782617 RepID=UPI001FFB5D01|nr:MobC family plasmid mobilization relaxosome protein [Bradyrhizobium sp. 141]